MRPRVWVVVAVALLLAGCSNADGPENDGPGTERTMRVLAAASLAQVVATLGEKFEAAHPGLRLQYSFQGSAELAASVRNGAPGDVLATADSRTMALVVRAGETLTEPVVVARNRLALVVPNGNPGTVRALDDLAREHLVVALCAPEAPCGSAAARLLRDAGVTAAVDTYEPDVTAVLTKVMADEVDVGIVYRTDLRTAGSAVTEVDLPDEAERVVNEYPVVVLRSTENRRLAKEFVAFLQSADARAALVSAGFELP